MKLNYREVLLRELKTRQLRNPAYNQSSFARLLGIPASRFSEILRGKVGLSISKATQIAMSLNLSPEESKLFIDMVIMEHSRSTREREEASKRVNDFSANYYLCDDNFISISDWHYHAIVELITSGVVEPTAKACAKSLGLSLEVAEAAIEKLCNLKLLDKDESGKLVATAKNRETTREIPSEAIKILNEQVLQKAAIELRDQDVSNRDFSIAFFAFNKSQMELAKERIKEFRRSFMKEFESSIGRDSVYLIGIQFFELTGKDKK